MLTVTLELFLEGCFMTDIWAKPPSGVPPEGFFEDKIKKFRPAGQKTPDLDVSRRDAECQFFFGKKSPKLKKKSPKPLISVYKKMFFTIYIYIYIYICVCVYAYSCVYA